MLLFSDHRTWRLLGMAACWLACTAGWARPGTPPGAADAPALDAPLGTGAGASRQAWSAAAALSRGINLAVFAAPREGDWGLRMDDRWIDALAKAGFRSVRFQVRWSNHADPGADAVLDEVFALRMDRVVDAFMARGLVVVLAVCCNSQLEGKALEEGEVAVAPGVVRTRFVNVWRQIARRYARRPDRLLFELGPVQPGDDHVLEALAAIRSSTPRRVVVIAPPAYDARRLAEMAVPPDPHLIVTVQNREPRQFIRQGLPQVEGADQWLGTPCCDPAQLALIARDLDLLKAWSVQRRYPVWLGLFGSASTAPMASRARFLRAMRDAAEARDIPWAHTDFAANFNVREPSQDSGFYDVIKGTWHTPLLEALLGP